MSIQINGTNGLTFNDGSSQQTAASGFGFKNRIINGACMIDQRNAGASVTIADSAFVVDRFIYYASQASKFTAGQNLNSVIPPTGFTNYAGFQTLSSVAIGASDYFIVGHKIEGLNVADLAWGTASASPVTLSFKVYSSLTGTFGGALRNSAANRSYPFTYTISSANTWTTISITIPGDTAGTWLTNNGVGIQVSFGLGVGSTYSGTAGSWSANIYSSVTGATSVVGTNGATWYITGVQLEKGSTATSFDYRPYGTELALCQRYFQLIDYQTGNGGISANWYTFNIPFLVSMRTAPTMTATAYNSLSGNAYTVQDTGTVNGWTADATTTNQALVRGSNTSLIQTIAGRGQFSAEL